MYLRDAVTTAVGVSYLLLMIAYQPIKACSCSPVTDEESFCRAKELVKLTVLEEKKTESEGDSFSFHFSQYNVRIEQVFKSTKGLTAQTEMNVNTPLSSTMCSLHLSPGSQYLISVSDYDDVLSANACSWMKEWDSVQGKVLQLLNGEIQPKCPQTEYNV